MKHNDLISKAMLGVASLLFVASAANAEGFSVGVSAVNAPISVEEAGPGAGGDSNGWRVHGQYMFNKHFGIEGGLSKFGTPSDNSIPSNMHADTEAYDVYAVVAYPFSEDAGLYAKAGVVSMNTETEVNDTNESHQTSTDMALALGGKYDITERFSIRAELEWFESALSGDLKYSLGGAVRF
jgi:OOP family OmpA-OmpF porin